MLRRIATLLLVVAIALGGMVSSACAKAHCAALTRARMHCCPTDGLRAERSCCGKTIEPAAPASAATLERAPQAPPLAALPALLPMVATSYASRGIAPVRTAATGPPTSLVGHHTSLLL